MNRVKEFLNNAKTFFIATTDGYQPKLRPFGGVMEYNGNFYFSINNTKNVYKQLINNSKIEKVAMSNGKRICITGKVIEDNSM